MSITIKIFTSACLLSVLSVSALAAADLRLVDAAKQGNREAVRSLLKQRVDVNAPQPDGTTALAWAAYRDDLEIADILIAAGANANAAQDYGVTPLVLACTNGSVAMVDKLLKARANVNAASENGETPLMRCAATGNVEAVKSLLAARANVNARDNRQGHTALMWATARKHHEVAQTLISGGADVDGRARSGFTALMFAAQQGDIDAVKMLLASGANINAATNEEGLWQGDTPLLLASLSGHQALSIFLLDNGADPNAADENGFTALHFAMLKDLVAVSRLSLRGGFGNPVAPPHLNRPHMMDLMKALVAHKANLNARVRKPFGGDKFYKTQPEPPSWSVSPVGATAFLMAAMAHDIDLMRFLATSGADTHIATDENATPLLVAAGLSRKRFDNLSKPEEEKALEAIKLLVELGADVNEADNVYGLTALHLAASSATDGILQFLVEKGADVNAKDKQGYTPLTKALDGQLSAGGAGNIRGGTKWKPTEQLLLKMGANPAKPSVGPPSGNAEVADNPVYGESKPREPRPGRFSRE